jgi:16S rRNA processing protein RimM
MTKQAYLECGRIVTTHGVRGAVKIESWCDTPQILAALPAVYLKEQDGSFSPKKLENPSVYKGQVMATLSGCSSMDDALLLRGRVLFAAREDIPLRAGQVLIADLIGLDVIDADSGKIYGRVRDIEPSAASDLYIVDTGRGDVYIPGVPEFIKERDPERGVFVRVIPGFFDDEV